MIFGLPWQTFGLGLAATLPGLAIAAAFYRRHGHETGGEEPGGGRKGPAREG